MDIVPHIDITGDDRLQAILDDERNFNLQALRAETLADWVPDLGTYLAPNECRSQNGVFRTPGLANSAIPAVLRHRFWEEADAVRITGTKYVGLLILDSEHDDCTFEISAGSEPVGVVKPWRHDNRRHLIVCSQPAHILGGWVPFIVRATGKGLCYLESVVFMPECPEPSSFAPEISRLSARLIQPDGDALTAAIDFVSSEAATATVAATPASGSADRISGQTETPERLHTITLRGLQSGARYNVQVTAMERGGATAQATLVLDTGPAKHSQAGDIRVPVEIIKLGRAPAAGLPLTFGIPLGQGVVDTPGPALLHCGGQDTPVQTRVHARWPDGSARWVLLDAPCPVALDASLQAPAEVILNSSLAVKDESAALHWSAGDGRASIASRYLRLTVSETDPHHALCIERRGMDSAWQPVIVQTNAAVIGTLGNGLALRSGAVTGLRLEETGPEHCTIRYELAVCDEHAVEHLHSTIWLHVFARAPFVRLVQRTVVTSPALGPAFGSKDLAHLTPGLDYLRSTIDGNQGEETSLLRLQALALRLPWAQATGATWQRIVHEHDRSYQIESAGAAKQIDGHWSGFLTVPGPNNHSGQVALCTKNFWQTSPKAVRSDADAVTIEILPKLSGQPLPDYDEQWHKLYPWLDAKTAQYRLKAGLALTTEILLGFPAQEGDAAAWQDWLEQPVVVRPEIHYLNATAALLPIMPKADSPHPHYETFMDGEFDVWQQQLAARHEYGFLNFGDTYSDVEGFWSNNEYDAAFCQYLEFLRGGDPRWALLGRATARHAADVDTCNFSRIASQIGGQYMHIPGHTGGYLPPYFRSKSEGSHFVPSHSWVEGEALHYLLTGDEAIRSAVLATGQRLTEGLRFYSFRNARECGWHLIHLTGLARMSDDARYLNAAAIIVATVLEKQAPGGGWEHPLSEAHCHHEPPRCHGEAGFMVGVLLAGLRRYHTLTGDPRVADAIIGGARWLLRKIYLPELQLFRYTSCPVCRKPAPIGGQLVEGLAVAYELAHDEAIYQALDTALSQAAQDEDVQQSGPRYGRSVNMEARYLPTTLQILRGPARAQWSS